MDEQTGAAGGDPASPSETVCAVEEQWRGRVAVLDVSGVIDMLTAPQLESAIHTVLGKDPTGLVVDLTGVEFLASAGMGVLVAANDKKAPQTGFCVVAEGPATSRPLKLVGIADIVKLYPTRDEALAALSDA